MNYTHLLCSFSFRKNVIFKPNSDEKLRLQKIANNGGGNVLMFMGNRILLFLTLKAL